MDALAVAGAPVSAGGGLLALAYMAQNQGPAATTPPFDFEAAVAEHVDSLYRAALRMTRKPDEAEDLVQETFLRAYRFRHQFEPGTNFRAWLFKIQTNVFRSRYRRAHGAEQSLDDTEDFYLYQHLGPDQPDGQDPAAQVLDRLGVEEVRSAIEELPAAYRETVLLTDVEGFSYRETAEILDIPVGTVMSRLHRGRQRLQRRLYDYAVDSGLIDADGDGKADQGMAVQGGGAT